MNTTKTGRTIVATATVLALIGGACSDDPGDTPAAGTTAPATTSGTPAGPAGLTSIDPDALQALVDETMEDMLVPGAVVLLRTPQGDIKATYGATELGGETPVPTPTPTSGSARSPRR